MPLVLAQNASQVAQLVLLGCVVVVVWWYVVRRVKQDRIPPQFWCYFLYLFGAVSLSMAWMPKEGMARDLPDGDLSRTQISLVLGAGFTLVGLAVHVILWLTGRIRRDREGPAWGWIFLAVLPLVFGIQFLHSRGLEQWLAYAVFGLIGLVVVCVGLLILGAYWAALRSPATRVARLIQAKRPDEAIRLGESVAEGERTAELEMNLGAAYFFAGKRDKAVVIFERLGAREDLAEPTASSVKDWLAHTEAGEPDSGSCSNEPPPG